MKIGIQIAAFLFALGTASAQTLDNAGLRIGTDIGNNTSVGTFVRASVVGQVFYDGWSTSLGASLSTSLISAVDLQQKYILPHCNRLSFGGRLLWRNLHQYHTDDLAAALYADWRSEHWHFELGLFGRFVGLTEPLNLYYSAEWCLRRDGDWNVALKVANYDDFIVERPHSPFVSLGGCYHIADRTELTVAAVLHQAGMFNLAAQYYESYLKLGVRWLW